MRDLERADSERSRNRATLIVVGIVVLTLFGASFALWQRAAMHGPGESNPLERFLRIQAAPRRERVRESDATVTVDPSKLTFERALSGHEDRPEVLAALTAAAREETHGGHPSSSKANETGTLAATGGSALKGRLPDASSKGVSPPVRTGVSPDGEFILHVISYENRKSAEALTRALRERGHEAFVAAGEVDGRGRYYRVRIGPFVSKGAADAYRRSFEARERMNTIVVRRQED